MATSEIIPAATVIIMRERADGPPELLMVERAQAMAFAGGALVFPGGRVDPGDHALAELHGGDPDDMAARIAAIRETLEEAGVAVGMDLPAAAIPDMRRRVYAGEPFGALLGAQGCTLHPERLVPFARWLPHGLRHRVFDTRFYLAQAPADAKPVVDGNENVRLFWAAAEEVLRAARAGEATLIFPTERTLERLALFASWEDAVADANAHPVRTIIPFIELRGGSDHLCIADDLGFPVTAVPIDKALRG